MSVARIVVAGYFVRYPLGGYAWCMAHYLLGLRALGHDAWFYEDTGYYELAYDPVEGAVGTRYDAGVRRAGAFFDRIGFGDRWVFADVGRGREHGPAAGRAGALLREADLLLNVGGANHVAPERRGGRPAVFVDLDPAYTQIKAASGDKVVGALLDAHDLHATIGENIGTPRSSIPTAGYRWHSTRIPVACDWWAGAGPAGATWTTVGRWDEPTRDLVWAGRAYRWRKRTEWLRCLDLPARTGAQFEIAMDVDNVPGDGELLRGHGWRVVDPLAVSIDPFRYRDYLRSSRGEFTVAKEMNIELRSGWFSDRAACYLAAGRPVVEQDTAFGDVLPLGPGLHAFRTADDAAAAISEVEADYARASAHATAVAREYFEAERVVARLLALAGL